MQPIPFFRLTPLVLGLFLTLTNFSFALTSEERRALDAIREQLQVAGKSFSAQKFDQAATEIVAAQDSLQKLLQARSDGSVERASEPLYERLVKAHKLLREQGVELKALPDWQAMLNPPPEKTMASTGISFSNDIAPWLVSSCGRCHIDQSRGGFSMATFNQLMKGSNAGVVVTAGNGRSSPIFVSIESGDMPRGGGRVTPDLQEKLRLWIDQGATYDGSDPNAPLKSLTMNMVASSTNGATDAPRMDRRLSSSAAERERQLSELERSATERFKRVLSKSTPSTKRTENSVIIGDCTPERLQSILEMMKTADEMVQKQLKLTSITKLHPNGRIVFVLPSRYDYSEFGNMVEGRQLPKDWQSHWKLADGVPYQAVVDQHQELELDLIRLSAATHFGTMTEVPYWFAEGMGQFVAINASRAKSELAKTWQTQSAQAHQASVSAAKLVEGKLDEQTAGAVGLMVIQSISTGSNRRKLDALTQQLESDKSFLQAMENMFGPTSAVLGRVLRP